MSDPQSTLDAEHLRLLTIFHYVVAGLGAIMSLLPTIYVGLGLAMILGKLPQKPGDPDVTWIGWFMVAIGSFLSLLGLAWCTLVLLASRCLARRRRYIFCMVVAAIECCFMPFGTVLGVFTLIVLSRPSVRELFQHGPAQPDAAPAVPQ